eukprot:Nk52_evm9s578 gene=Nk52_evmTU9s578
MSKTGEEKPLLINVNEEKTALIAPASSSEASKGTGHHAEGKHHSAFTIFCVVAWFWCVSLCMLFTNKVVLKNSPYTVPAPLFATWFQCVVAVFMMRILSFAKRFFSSLDFLPDFDIKLDTMRAVLPLSFAFVGMISFSNTCLKFVDVSFYSIARSMTIIFNIILTYLILNTKTSFKAMSCCSLLVIGFVMGGEGEMHFSLIGVFFGICSSMFSALNSIAVKKVMPHVGGNSFKLSLYNNFNAIFILLPFTFLTGDFQKVMGDEKVFMWQFWALLTLSGVLGFLIGIATYTQISYTSPLTHNISGNTRNGVQSFIAPFIFPSERMGFLKACGILMCVGGAALYSMVRFGEMNAAKKAEEERKNALPK